MKKKHIVALACIFMACAFVFVPFSGKLDAGSLPMATTALSLSDWGIGNDSAAATVEATPYTSTAYPFSTATQYINQYQKINKDVIGWLNVPGTGIQEPIVFTNQDSNYYLYRDINGKNYPNTDYLNYVNTAIYADYRTKFGATWQKSSKNIVLYGHNWNNLRYPMKVGDHQGLTMFAQLPSYTDLTFAKTNPHVYFSLGDNSTRGTTANEGIWRVFAVGYTETSKDFFYNHPNPSDEKMQELIDGWAKRSIFKYDVDVAPSDHILTMTTCTRVYDAGAMKTTQRYVVVARLLREGETENDTVRITKKADNEVLHPNFSVATKSH